MNVSLSHLNYVMVSQLKHMSQLLNFKWKLVINYFISDFFVKLIPKSNTFISISFKLHLHFVCLCIFYILQNFNLVMFLSNVHEKFLNSTFITFTINFCINCLAIIFLHLLQFNNFLYSFFFFSKLVISEVQPSP